MTENVSYKRCICDFCKKETHVATSLLQPLTWNTLMFKEKLYDICEECTTKIDLFIDNETHGRY